MEASGSLYGTKRQGFALTPASVDPPFGEVCRRDGAPAIHMCELYRPNYKRAGPADTPNVGSETETGCPYGPSGSRPKNAETGSETRYRPSTERISVRPYPGGEPPD